MWIKDPKTGEKSVTVTLTLIAFFTILLKYLIGGMAFGSFTVSPVDASDFTLIVAPLLATYAGRKFTDKDKTEKK